MTITTTAREKRMPLTWSCSRSYLVPALSPLDSRSQLMHTSAIIFIALANSTQLLSDV